MNPAEFIIIITLSLSVFMAAGLLIRSIHYRNVIFSLLLLCLSYVHFFSYLMHTQYILIYPHFFFIQHPVIITIGPLLYFYTLSLFDEKKVFRIRDILHFSGTILLLLFFAPYMIKTADEKRELINKIISADFHFIRLAATAVIAVVMIYAIISLRKIIYNANRNNRSQQKIILVIVLFTGWLIIGIAGFIIAVTTCGNITVLFNLGISIIIICIFFLDQRYPYLLRFATVPVKQKQYLKSRLDKIDLDNLNRQLTLLMEEEKLYCDEDLTLSRLSRVLEITPHQLSQFLNEYYNKNFNNYINDYRLAEAKQLIAKDISNSILSIAFASGFNSYSAFHRVFKKATGLSPAEFRQKNIMK